MLPSVAFARLSRNFCAPLATLANLIDPALRAEARPAGQRCCTSQAGPDDLPSNAGDVRNLSASFRNVVEPQPVPQLRDGTVAPWTPTSHVPKRKVYARRMRHMIETLNKEYHDTVSEPKRTFPHFKPGDVLAVDLVVPENDMRPGKFTGICMAIKRNGPMTRFTMRNIVKATGPVERSFLLYSPFIKAIKIRRSVKVRRAKLTYLREQSDAANTFGQ